MATAVGTVQEQVAGLEAEVSELKERLAGEEKDLDSLEHERGAVSEQIALGKEKASRASTIARQIEERAARINGFRSILAGKQSRLDELYPALRKQEEDARRTAALSVVTELGAQGLVAIDQIEKAFASTAPHFEKLAEARKELERHAQDSLWAPMRGQPIPATAARANEALTELGNRLRLLSERTGWIPQR